MATGECTWLLKQKIDSKADYKYHGDWWECDLPIKNPMYDFASDPKKYIFAEDLNLKKPMCTVEHEEKADINFSTCAAVPLREVSRSLMLPQSCGITGTLTCGKVSLVCDPNSKPGEKQEYTIHLGDCTLDLGIKNADNIKESKTEPYCKLHIMLNREEDKKLVLFQVDAGMNSSLEGKMTNDDSNARGFFNDSAYVKFKLDDTQRSQYKATNFIVEKRVPDVNNHAVQLTRSSSWKLSPSLKIAASKNPGVEATVSGEYGKHSEVGETVQDFQVVSEPGAYSEGWRIYCSATDENNWKQHTLSKVRLANAAKATLPLRTEHLLSAPLNAKDTFTWTFLFKATFKLLKAGSTFTPNRCYSVSVCQTIKFDMNMDSLEVTLENVT